MKKFIQKILFFTLFCGFFMILLPIAIDPYNVFHAKNIRDNGVEPNTNYVKMKYILENPTRFDAFLFGSSRVGAIHTDRITDVNCYNMTYSEGLPKEHLENLKTLLANDIIPKRIYLGVDSLSYTLNPRVHYTDHSRASYEYSKSNPVDFYTLYFDPYVALKSLKTTLAHTPSPDYSSRFYNYGWWCEYDQESHINKDSIAAVTGEYEFIDDTIASITEFVNLCEENNIELIVFTNPMHYINYFNARSTYADFLEKLASVTDFYNFSSLNDITLRDENYVDYSHYNAQTGDLMLSYLSGDIPSEDLLAQGFGYYVTKDNVQEFLALLESQFSP